MRTQILALACLALGCCSRRAQIPVEHLEARSLRKSQEEATSASHARSVLARLLVRLNLASAFVAPGSKVAVVGATGKVGRLAVQQLVQQGYTARVLLRNTGTSEAPAQTGASAIPTADDDVEAVAAWYASNPPGVEKVQGDVTNRESLDELLKGCSAVLALHGARRTRQLSDFWRDSTLDPRHSKNVNYLGVSNLIEAARASESCKRIVRLTGKGETPWSIFSILINGMGSMAKAWNYEGENLLRACDDLEYTIVRPGVMRGDESEMPKASLVLADNGGDLKVTSIPHSSIAKLCVESLEYSNAGRSTLCAMAAAEPGEGSDDWKPLLNKVKADSRMFRDDLLSEHHLAVRVGGTAIVALLCGLALGLLKLLSVTIGLLSSLR